MAMGADVVAMVGVVVGDNSCHHFDTSDGVWCHIQSECYSGLRFPIDFVSSDFGCVHNIDVVVVVVVGADADAADGYDDTGLKGFLGQ